MNSPTLEKVLFRRQVAFSMLAIVFVGAAIGAQVLLQKGSAAQVAGVSITRAQVSADYGTCDSSNQRVLQQYEKVRASLVKALNEVRTEKERQALQSLERSEYEYYLNRLQRC